MLQDIKAVSSPITDFHSKPNGGYVTIDMTPAYAGQVGKVVRRANFNRERKSVTLIDNITAAKEAVRLAIMTRSEIIIEGPVAILKSNKKTLKVIRNNKHGGKWKILDAMPSTPEENQNEGYRILAFTAPVADELKLSVTFKP